MNMTVRINAGARPRPAFNIDISTTRAGLPPEQIADKGANQVGTPIEFLGRSSGG
jgi:hypothetical protein